jgi:4-aminobutyrate aminotransferase
MIGIELVKDRGTKTPAQKERDRIIDAAFQKGLLLLGCGESGIRFCPPLVVTKKHVDVAVSILKECFNGLA